MQRPDPHEPPPLHVIPPSHARRRQQARQRAVIRRRRLALIGGLLVLVLLAVAAAGGFSGSKSGTSASRGAATGDSHRGLFASIHNVYAHDYPTDLSPVVAHDRPLIYVPNSGSNTVTEIDPRTFKIVRQFPVGDLPQHIVPAWDLRTLYVTNDYGNSLTPIDPRTGVPGNPIPVTDPYNLYFAPDGRHALVMAEARKQINFLDPHTMKLEHSLSVPTCAGVNHADFTADGRYMLASCEFGDAMIVVDLARQAVIRTLPLPPNASPQDVKLSPDGRTFYVADLHWAGLWVFDARTWHRIGLLHTGAGAHGLYPSRNTEDLYVSNRTAGTISVVKFKTRRVIATWPIPNASPDMGNVSVDGRVLWLSGRYSGSVYAIDTRTGKLIANIATGAGPHGLCVWPQPGRYSLGHTGIMR